MTESNSNLRVSLVQGDTRWHDPAGNRQMYGDLVRSLAGSTDLVVLPETLTSGFTNETLGNAEGMDGASVAWLRELAAAVGAVITGSIVVRDGERHYNRLIWMRPDGSHASYDKRHLFRYADEHLRYSAGRKRLVVELGPWRVCPQICYDLRFPVFARNRFVPAGTGEGHSAEYDLLLYVANWPAPRHHAWQTLLRARAIENLCYAIGVNRVGSDGNQLSYLGGSVVLDPLGMPIVECGSQPQVVSATISRMQLDAHRERFPFYLDADAFSLIE
jgi:predicted amidohydrolase